jgi:orotidine-5'-phosphate decarboxylase
VGIDPHLERVPGVEPGQSRVQQARAVARFGCAVVEAVGPLVAAVKPQVAFFEQLGSAGVAALEEVVVAAREQGLLVVLDAKRGDIGSTARAYARATLDDEGPLGADAVTLSPYLGPESLAPFVERCEAGKGLFVLLRTSNAGAGPWQRDTGLADAIADWVAQADQATDGSVGVVVGATLPDEAARWRSKLPRSWFLVPGVGAQGATAADVRGHGRADGLGALVTSSRGVIFPAEGRETLPQVRVAVAERARALVDELRAAGLG